MDLCTPQHIELLTNARMPYCGETSRHESVKPLHRFPSHRAGCEGEDWTSAASLTSGQSQHCKRLRKRHHKQPQTLCPVQHFRCYACTRRTLFDSAIRCSRPSEHNCWRNCVLKSIWGCNKSSQRDLDTRKRCVRWLSAFRVPNVTTPSIGLQMRWRSLYRQVSLASPKLRFVLTWLCLYFEDFRPRPRYVWRVGRHITRACTRCLCGWVRLCFVCLSPVGPLHLNLSPCVYMCFHLLVSACLRASPCISTRLFALPHLLPSHCVSMRLVALPYVVMRLLLSCRVSPGLHQSKQFATAPTRQDSLSHPSYLSCVFALSGTLFP